MGLDARDLGLHNAGGALRATKWSHAFVWRNGAVPSNMSTNGHIEVGGSGGSRGGVSTGARAANEGGN